MNLIMKLSERLCSNGLRTHTMILKAYKTLSWPKNIKPTSDWPSPTQQSTRLCLLKPTPKAFVAFSAAFDKKTSRGKDPIPRSSFTRTSSRRAQWGAIWVPVDEPCHIHGFRELREDAIQQAHTLQPINPLSLQRVIKKLPHKASGPDGVSYDFLKQLLLRQSLSSPTCSIKWSKKLSSLRKCGWSTS